MPARLNPYISFQGDAREAMESYHRLFGGELAMTTFAESGIPHDPADAGKVMHASLQTADGEVLMAADVPTGQEPAPISGISLSLSGDDDAALSGWFEGLSDRGTVLQPLTAAPWGDKFGMVTDRFGVTWFVNISSGQQPG